MNWNPRHLPDQTGKTFVVTGTTAGIGYFAAEQLAAAGAHVVLASRSAAKMAVAERAIRGEVPEASLASVVLDLASFASVDVAASELAKLERIDGVLLNGGAMSFAPSDATVDGLPTLLGTHLAANVRLVSRLLPALSREHAEASRVVHTSTGFVELFPFSVDDVRKVPRSGVAAYTKAKTATEVFAFELDRRLRAAQVPVLSLVVRPGVGVDARTPRRAGIRDNTVPYQRNFLSPWGQGKDTAAWAAVRALTDPTVVGGEYFAPTGRFRGQPVAITPIARTANPGADVAAHVWRQLEDLAGVLVRIPRLGVAAGSEQG